MTAKTFTVRRALPSDIDAIEALVNLAYRGGLSTVSWKNEHHLVQGARITEDELIDALSSDSSIILLACTEDGTIVGSVEIEKHGNDAHIGMLAVHPEYQNFGLGRKLLEAGGETAKTDFECSKAKMFVLCGRPELLAWYSKAGYEASGERQAFFGPESRLTPLIEDAHFVVVEKALL